MPTDPPLLRIELFDPARHNRAAFDCGPDRLNKFLKLSARKQQRDDMSRVYVVVEEGNTRILGYHAIHMGAVETMGNPSYHFVPYRFGCYSFQANADKRTLAKYGL